MEISPHRGIDNILLGSSQAEIRNQLGEPESILRGQYEDNVDSDIWTYRLLRLELAFDSDVDYRLARITTTHPDVHIAGFNPIGLSENFLMMKYPNLELQGDFEDSGKDYVDRATDLSFWLENGKVTNITIYPDYDTIEQVPRWPRN